MNKWIGKNLSIGNLTAAIPIVQGGMGIGISMSGLASAVANEGGIGVISSALIGMLEKDLSQNYISANIRALRNEIRKARSMTKGILGVNIMVAMSNFSDMVKTALEEGIDIIFSGAGLPIELPSFLSPKDQTKLVPIISSGRVARIIAKRWWDRYRYVPDAFVVEGPKAGGHLGFRPDELSDPNFQLEKLIPEVVKEVSLMEEASGKKIPVIAAGGIYTGADIHKFFELGASGVQMGTRFVTTTECDASLQFKNAYIESKEEDIVIIKSPVGMPGRAIRNKFISELEKNGPKKYRCPHHCIVTCNEKSSPFCIANALMNAYKGKMDHGFAFAGANAFRATKIQSVKELIHSIIEEYNLCKNHSFA